MSSREVCRILPMARGTLTLFLALLSASCGPRETSVDGGQLGQVRLFEPADPAQSIVVFYGDAAGWSSADDAAAKRLAASGTVVAGVDLPEYLRALNSAKGPCLYLAGDAERLSRSIERRLEFAGYESPVVAGTGIGGALSLAMLKQSPPATLSAAAAIDPTSDVPTNIPLCQQPPRSVGVASAAADQKRFIAFSGRALTDGRAKEVLAKMGKTESWPHVVPLLAATSNAESLASVLALHVLPAVRAERATRTLSDLPLVEMPAEPGAPLAVVLSGDGGWRDIDKQIADDLRHRGYSVIGWDSLRYFWREKSPEALGRDLSLALATFMSQWHAKDVLLVGYSFGADVLPFAYNRLSPDLRERVREIALLGYGGHADFEIRVAGWLGAPASEGALDAAPEMAKIDPALMQCFYGREEADSACPQIARTGGQAVELQGGHHFDSHYDKIAQQIVRKFALRASAAK
jgi:type IV secretory pathway VirJ component